MLIKPEHRANLEKLAAHLERLPKDYRHFNMRTYRSKIESPDTAQESFVNFDPVPNQTPLAQSPCGTVACAVGHGPDAGIEASDADGGKWDAYARRVFGQDDRDYAAFPDGGIYVAPEEESYGAYLFASHREQAQPTARAAAARIRYVLDNNGPPPDWKSVDDIYTVY